MALLSVVGVPRVVLIRGFCLSVYGLWTGRKHSWKLIVPVMDGLNNAVSCHLCTDVAVPFSDDSSMAFGIRPPSLWFQLGQ